jgi:phosphoglycerate dehydrogenase-like enzyme
MLKQNQTIHDAMTHLVICSRDSSAYKNYLKQRPDISLELVYAGLHPTPIALANAKILLGEPDLIAPIISKCPNLEWIQSSWAGNNKLQHNNNAQYVLTGVKGIFAQQMTEYVLAYILYFQRSLEQFKQLKAERVWSQIPSVSLVGKTLGIMGMGNIGQAVGKQLHALGITIIGLSHSSKNLPNIDTYTSDHLAEFLSRCDYIVNFLPETKNTIGFCDAAFFKAMRKGSIFINAGRGTVIDEPKALIDELSRGHLEAAVLDVFEQEPLPKEHPYYNVDNIYITCHTAAVSAPADVFDIFTKNLALFRQKKPMLYQHDFNKGY